VFETAYAQFRFAASLFLSQPFHIPSLQRLVDALVATRREFGALTADTAEFVSGPELDEPTRQELQLRRFRAQARIGAKETRYYAALFTESHLNPRQLTWEEILDLPLFTKGDLHKQLPDLVRRNQNLTVQMMTTGTTGRYTGMVFTSRELEVFALLSALSLLISNTVSEQDIVQVSTSARALLGNSTFMGACQRIGALVYQTGIIAPPLSLEMLVQNHTFPAKAPRPSVLMTYPSYLGMLLQSAQREGYAPEQFGLKRIILGGEIVTAGIKRRWQNWFGELEIGEGYGISETWPFGATRCEQGRLHFDPTQGLMEVTDPDTGRPAEPGEVGALVLTPFVPYRESVVLLRYNTQDLVQVLDSLCTCSLQHMPATSHLLGKYALSVRHKAGWVCPRHILEAIEGIDGLPLPARCGFWVEGNGVAVEVVVPQPTQVLRSQIGDSLEANGVPVHALHLVTDAAELRYPLPWRGDLREASFSPEFGRVEGRQQ
jgi:phenylacetate-coenzyme A ligase PaaK-like adenylate-forming protein